ncbi:hypothetical protein P8452_32834 [Trifolium repens]|nr:hypothetical protein P8452_32834 [Trifolium repens]
MILDESRIEDGCCSSGQQSSLSTQTDTLARRAESLATASAAVVAACTPSRSCFVPTFVVQEHKWGLQ